MSRKLNSEEALFAFCAWLTTRRGTLKVGESHNAADTCQLLEEFLEWNDLKSGEDVCLETTDYPPRLWYRYTPALGEFEWWLRKKWRDTVVTFNELFGDPHTCP